VEGATVAQDLKSCSFRRVTPLENTALFYFQIWMTVENIPHINISLITESEGFKIFRFNSSATIIPLPKTSGVRFPATKTVRQLLLVAERNRFEDYCKMQQ